LTGTQALPMKEISSFFEDIGSARGVCEFAERTVAAIGRVLPFDANALFVIEEDRGRIISWKSPSDCAKLMEAYNERFFSMIPHEPEAPGRTVDWRAQPEMPFVREFIRPQGIRWTIDVFAAPSRRGKASLVLHRGGKSRPFGERERRICSVLQPHMRNLLALNLRAEDGIPLDPDPEALSRRFRELSRREVEIVSMVAGGRTTGMIAQSLFISRYTVYRHLENIYAKLGIHRREELVELAAAAGR
jgi:DNA-binding CsgD family transcriptional regulator